MLCIGFDVRSILLKLVTGPAVRATTKSVIGKINDSFVVSRFNFVERLNRLVGR